MRAVFLGACVALSVASVVHAKCNGVQKFDDETGKACVQVQANVGPNMRVQQGNLVVSLREGKKVSNGVWLGTQRARVREIKRLRVCMRMRLICVCVRVPCGCGLGCTCTCVCGYTCADTYGRE